MSMSHSKIAFLILNLALIIASTAIAQDQDDARFRYFRPLSTNVKPEELKHSDQDENFAVERSIYRKEKHSKEEFDEDDEEQVNDSDDLEELLKEPKVAIEFFRESKRKAEQIERELRKRRHQHEQDLKKFLAEIDREHKKHIVEIEREQRRIRQEIEREYKKNLKKMDLD